MKARLLELWRSPRPRSILRRLVIQAAAIAAWFVASEQELGFLTRWIFASIFVHQMLRIFWETLRVLHLGKEVRKLNLEIEERKALAHEAVLRNDVWRYEIHRKVHDRLVDDHNACRARILGIEKEDKHG